MLVMLLLIMGGHQRTIRRISFLSNTWIPGTEFRLSSLVESPLPTEPTHWPQKTNYLNGVASSDQSWPCCAAEDDLEVLILLPLSSKCWSYRLKAKMSIVVTSSTVWKFSHRKRNVFFFLEVRAEVYKPLRSYHTSILCLFEPPLRLLSCPASAALSHVLNCLVSFFS